MIRTTRRSRAQTHSICWLADTPWFSVSFNHRPGGLEVNSYSVADGSQLLRSVAYSRQYPRRFAHPINPNACPRLMPTLLMMLLTMTTMLPSVAAGAYVDRRARPASARPFPTVARSAAAAAAATCPTIKWGGRIDGFLLWGLLWK